MLWGIERRQSMALPGIYMGVDVALAGSCLGNWGRSIVLAVS